MSNPNDLITHPGIVKKIDHDRVFVMILAQSACASCHAKGFCSVADMEEKIIEVNNVNRKKYTPGEKVNVTMKKTLGPKAVLLGYLIPFFIVLITLVITLSLSGNEGLSALVSLSFLLPYYTMLYRMRDRLKKKFMFTLE